MIYNVIPTATRLTEDYMSLNNEDSVRKFLAIFNLTLMPDPHIYSYCITPYDVVMVNQNEKDRWLYWSILAVFKSPKHLKYFIEMPDRVESALSLISSGA